MNQRAVPNPPERRLVNLGAWVIVLLDSAVPGQVYGNLEKSELAFLEQALAARDVLEDLEPAREDDRPE